MATPLNGLALLDYAQVLEILSLSDGSLKRQIKMGLIPKPHKVPGTRLARWFRRDIEDYLMRLRLGLLEEPKKTGRRKTDKPE